MPVMQDFASVHQMAFLVPVAGGAALFIYSLITDYSAGVKGMIPFKVHLTIDFIAAVALILTPIVFGFEGFAKMFLWIVGIAVILVVLLTNADDV